MEQNSTENRVNLQIDYYVCNIDGCPQLFTTIQKLKEHWVIHGKKPFVCTLPYCGQSFAFNEVLNLHILMHADNKIYSNDINKKLPIEGTQNTSIGEAFPFYGILANCADTQLKPERRVRYMCKVEGCRKLFTMPSLYLRHVEYHSNERPFVCDVKSCGRAFKHFFGLNKHCRNIHGRSIKSIKEESEAQEQTATSETSIDVKPSQNLKTIPDLPRDVKSNSAEVNTEFYKKCHVTKEGINKSNIADDKIIRNNKQVYVCNLEKCIKSYMSIKALKLHRRRYHKLNGLHEPNIRIEHRNFGECGKNYSTSNFTAINGLSTYSKMECSEGDKEFYIKDTLKKRDKYHSITTDCIVMLNNDNPQKYFCNLEDCNRSYESITALKLHIRRKHNKLNHEQNYQKKR